MTKHDPHRREAIVGFVAGYVKEHGYGPSVREVMRAVGLRSSSAAYHHLRALREARVLTGEGEKCQQCGAVMRGTRVAA